MFRRAWLPNAPERVLVVVHGLAEHSGRYEHFGAWMAQRGCAVHALDQRGHGQSSGRRGFVGRFDQFLDDLALFAERVTSEHPDSRISLLGHSMGGLVAILFAMEREHPFQSLVATAPLLALPGALPWWKRFGAQLLGSVWPTLSMSAGIDSAGLSRDPEVARLYAEDPLVFDVVTAALGSQIISAIDRVTDRGDDIGVPFLLLHGEADQLAPTFGSERLFESLSLEHRSDGELGLYPSLRHEILNEPEGPEIFDRILSWLPAHGG